jgi:hypothetical protein
MRRLPLGISTHGNYKSDGELSDPRESMRDLKNQVLHIQHRARCFNIKHICIRIFFKAVPRN